MAKFTRKNQLCMRPGCHSLPVGSCGIEKLCEEHLQEQAQEGHFTQRFDESAERAQARAAFYRRVRVWDERAI